jgi:diaminopimelate decarboxylase
MFWYSKNMFTPSSSQAHTIAQAYGTPTYVTDLSTLRHHVRDFADGFSGLPIKIFYAMKANYNPTIIRAIKEAGIFGIDAVSPYEVRLALLLGYSPEQIIFTPSNPSDAEISYVGGVGVLQNLGSLSELERYGKMFPSTEVSIRISPEVGAGESKKVITGQSQSKFGISLEDMSWVRAVTRKYKLKITGIHSHIGSGFYTTKQFKQSVKAVCGVAREFSEVRFIDMGGGFGVSYHPDKKDIDISNFARAIKPIVGKYEKETGKTIEVRIEPGKFLVSRSTVLLTTVTTVKKKKDTLFVGVDAGFNNLIRPAMYDAYHHVVNLSNQKGKRVFAQIVGNVCETCDVFNKGLEISNPREGDLLGILCAGGYGASMSSNYNIRPRAPEVCVDGVNIILAREKDSFEDIMRGYTL